MESENVSPTTKKQRGRKRKASNSVETETGIGLFFGKT